MAKLQTICADCGASARFDDAAAAIAADWQRLKCSAPIVREVWFCPAAPRATVSAKLEALVADGLQVITEGRILE